MICARCGQQTSDRSRCGHCGEPPLLGGRYRFDEVIGRGSSGVTYRATRVSDGQQVCVKELLYRRMASFKDEELFHREAAVLKQLDHPSIPDYLDEFAEGEGKAYGLYLVQEFVDGRNLREEMETHRYREDEVLEILLELSAILAYLHGLRPPVVHRDIKPSNVMRRRRDGRLVLVDFGSVKKTLADATVGGTTVAGTFGYMAPEQLFGQAEPVSDLYALGMLGLVLLTGRQPDALVDDERRLDWQRRVRARKATLAVLENLLERDPKRRARKTRRLAQQLRRALDEVREPVKPPKPKKASRQARRRKPRPASPDASGRKGGKRIKWGAVVPYALVLGVGGFFYWRTQVWSGDKTLYCHGDTERTIEEVSADLGRTVISAHGRCRLTLIRCNLRTHGSRATVSVSGRAQVRIVGGRLEGGTYVVKATDKATVVLDDVAIEGRPAANQLSSYRAALYARNRAQIVVRGGTLRDPQRAMFARRNAIIAYQGTRIQGRTRTYSGGRIVEVAAGSDPEKTVTAERQQRQREVQARAAKRRRYAQQACEGIRACYRQHGAQGYAVGRVTLTVDSAGIVRRVRLHAPGAPPQTLTCLNTLMDQRRIPDFDERGGTVTCAYSGDPAGAGRAFGVKTKFRAR